MVSIETIITVASIAIAFLSLTFTAVTFLRNRDKDVKNETKDNVEIHANLQSQIDILGKTIPTQLETIDSGVRDLRADNRGLRSDITKMCDDLRDEIKEVHDEAKHGVELAEAAHRRLDRLGAEPDLLVKKIEKGN